MIVRRTFDQRHDQPQVFVEYDTATGTMRVATRRQSWDTWGPPLNQIRNEDEGTIG